MTEEIVVSNQALIQLGDMPKTAQEIHDYIRDALVVKATPLKARSLDLHQQVIDGLPGSWEAWDLEEIEFASKLYDAITAHEKTVRGKGTELDTIRDKAEKLKKGILRALDDIMGELPTDKESLMTKIREWRKRAQNVAEKEEKRLADIAQKAEDDRKIAAAAEKEAEADKLRASGLTEQATEVQAEATAILDEPILTPPPIVTATIPKGGPRKQTYWKYQVIDFKKLVVEVAAGRVPINALKPDDVFLGQQARSLRNNLKYGGVKVWSE